MRRVTNNKLEALDKKGNLHFYIVEVQNENMLTLFVSGNIINETFYEFDDEMRALLSACQCTLCKNPTCNRVTFNTIILELSEVNYICSEALRALLIKYQRIIDDIEGASMIILNPSEEVYEKLEGLGYLDSLDIRFEDYGR